MPFKIEKLSDTMLKEMATAWVRGEIFSELHVHPYNRELVMAIFPSAKEAMQNSSNATEIRENCGMICGVMEMRSKDESIKMKDPDASVRVYPVFHTCIFIHKDQRQSLQKAIEAERLFKKWMVRSSRKLPGKRFA